MLRGGHCFAFFNFKLASYLQLLQDGWLGVDSTVPSICVVCRV